VRKMTFEETKQVELEILEKVAGFCDAHGIRYYLGFGTLIGTIRHKGFIPWDDDIDIWIPRCDYNRFLEIFPQKNNNDRYELVSPYSKKSRHSFAKIIDTKTLKIEKGVDYSYGAMGVDLDIFPLDGQPESDEEFNKYYNKKRFYYIIYNFAITKFNFGSLKYRLLKLALFWTKFFKVAIVKRCDRISAKYAYETSQVVGSTASLYNTRKERFKKEWFEEYKIAVFENREFKIPAGYDNILRTLYGDYMKLPPEKERLTHHSYDTYWKDDIEGEEKV